MKQHPLPQNKINEKKKKKKVFGLWLLVLSASSCNLHFIANNLLTEVKVVSE